MRSARSGDLSNLMVAPRFFNQSPEPFAILRKIKKTGLDLNLHHQ